MKFDYYITGTIGESYDWWTGTRGTTADMVKTFLNAHKDQELTIAVSSLGGYLDDGLAIMEYIKDHGKCNMVIIGMTASAATILCMKAKSIKISRGSMMLIHNSSQTLDVWTSANKEKIDQIIQQFQHDREQLDTIDKCMADIYSMRNGKTIDENLDMMAKEKWLSADDALSFGLVDAVLDDDDLEAKAKSVKSAFAGRVGAAEHYGAPALEGVEPQPSRSLYQRMKDALQKMTGIINEAEPAQVEDTSNQTFNKPSAMKKLILNLFCAVLSLQEIELDTEAGTARLTEDQLTAIENDLKAKADQIADLQSQLTQAQADKKTAEDAKATAEQNLNTLQQQFDAFKQEAGGESPEHPLNSPSAHQEPKTAKEMYNSIKNLL